MNVDYAHAVKKRDHHEFLGGLALSGLLGSGRSSMLPLGTLSLGLWVITIDPASLLWQLEMPVQKKSGNLLNAPRKTICFVFCLLSNILIERESQGIFISKQTQDLF